MILKGYPRISETFISNEILLLEELGFAIHLFSMRQPREDFTHDSVKKIRARVDYLPETLLKPLPRLLYHNLILASKRPAAYAAALKTAIQRFSRTRKVATVKHLLQAGYLANRLLPGSHVTHLHAHFAHSPTSVAMFTSQLAGLPFSFTAHAKDIYTSDPRQLREKIALSRFVVTCTEYNRRHLLEISDGHKTPIDRIYHGIDIQQFSYRAVVGRKPVQPFQLLTVARLTPKKGLPTVYRALKILADRGIQFKHTLIGDGEDRGQVQHGLGYVLGPPGATQQAGRADLAPACVGHAGGFEHRPRRDGVDPDGGGQGCRQHLGQHDQAGLGHRVVREAGPGLQADHVDQITYSLDFRHV